MAGERDGEWKARGRGKGGEESRGEQIRGATGEEEGKEEGEL